MKKTFFLVLLSGSICLAPAAAILFAAGQPNDEIVLYVGDIKSFPVNGPQRIAVGKPAIADVTQVTESEITLSAKAAGDTTFIIWDNLGEQDFHIKVFVENMSEAKGRVDSLIKELNLPNVYTRASDSESKVLLLGEVKTAQERERILSALGTLKDKVVDLMKVQEEETIVDIDVEVLELNKDATNTLGFSWPGSVTLYDVSGPAINPAVVEAGSGGGGDTKAGIPATGLRNVFHLSPFVRSAFNVTLDALVQEGKACVLSRPRVACQSGKEAELAVGGEKPILTTQSVSGGGTSTQVDYKEFGIKLKIKPVVTPDRRVKLGLNVEVSSVGTAEVLGSATNITAKAWPLNKRTVYTELVLNDNQTMAIGGLRSQREEVDTRKTPWLSEMPVIGALWRQKQTLRGGGRGELGDSELFITLTPTIVSKKEVSKPAFVPASAMQTQAPVDPLQNYSNIVKKRILGRLNYPASAKEAGLQGTVKLSLHLSYVGQLLNVSVISSSGYHVLDDNAVAVTKEIASYPPFPPALAQKDLWIEIPIVYSLE